MCVVDKELHNSTFLDIKRDIGCQEFPEKKTEAKVTVKVKISKTAVTASPK